MKEYRIEFSKKAKKDYEKLPEQARRLIDSKLLLLASSPYSQNNNIKRLKGEEKCYRLRVGAYRIVYEIMDEVLIIFVIRIGQRKEVYRYGITSTNYH